MHVWYVYGSYYGLGTIFASYFLATNLYDTQLASPHYSFHDSAYANWTYEVSKPL